MFNVSLPLDDNDALVLVTLEKNQNKIKIKSLIDTGAEYSQVSSDVAQKLNLYNSNYQDAGEIRVDNGSYNVYKTDVNIIVFLKDLLKNSSNRNSVSADHHIGETITVLFPKDKSVQSSVPMIIGRETIEKLGLVIQIE